MDSRTNKELFKMKNLSLLVLLLLVSGKLYAGIFMYDVYLPQTIQEYLKDMQAGSKASGGPQCESMYAPMLADGVLDIHYAFGYFDDSETGTPRIFNGVNYGISPSLDLVAFESLRQVIVGSCRYKNMRLCGFTQSGDPQVGKLIFEKQMLIQGQDVLVRIIMTQASASESYAQNRGPLADTQRFFTAQSEENFFGGLRTGDVVFYNGHSRNGGGPDFNPPVLTKANKTNYKGYYEVQKPGIKRTLEELAANPNPGFVLGLFSCYSRTHFYKSFMNQNPQQRLILSADTIDYFDSMKASIGYLEGILRGQCGEDLSRTAKRGEKVRKGYQQYQMK
jgi:hypothetical protein